MGKTDNVWENIKKTKLCKTLKAYWGSDDWIGLGLAAAGVFYYLFQEMLTNYPGWRVFYESIHAELIGIGVTVLILGNANQHMRIQQEKRSLILQMGSPDNTFAIEAVRLLRRRGWFFNGTLQEAYLHKANLKNSNLVDGDFEGAYMRSSNLEDAKLWKANLKRVNFTNAHLNRAELVGAYLERSDFSWANLEYSDLSRAILTQSDLSWANCKNARLINAVLVEADLHGARLQGADLTNANLEDSNLQGAKYNKDTLWPEGFDTQSAGCILVEDE